MRTKVKLLACLAGGLAPWLMIASSPASAGDETYTLKQIINLPDGQSLGSFDIGFDDANIHTYALADRTNKSVDIIDTNTNTVTKQLHATPPFAGGHGATGGPNGVIIVDQKEVWAGDAFGLLKAIDLATGNTIAVMNTGGQLRSDELCEDVADEIVMIANDEVEDSFVTFWSSETYQMLGKITFKGKDPAAKNIIANGIEQCKYNPRIGAFFLNLPATMDSKGNPLPGVTLQISARAPFRVEKVFTFETSLGCGPTGLAIGPGHQMLLGCSGTNSLIIDDRDGSILTFLGGETSDEAWYNPGDNTYFLADDLKLGSVDAATGAEDVTTVTATGSHSVAADMLKNQIYIPVNNVPAEGGASHICGNNGGSDSKGCIAVYHSTHDDHCLAAGFPVLDHDDGDDPVYMRTQCSQDLRAERTDNATDR
ncbi:MAG TPA: hypothetical protein VKW08_23525 [Xanthobacteraceae bacterium]|nr:hypothetical protein [Xanthobacteraceae bacterium]